MTPNTEKAEALNDAFECAQAALLTPIDRAGIRAVLETLRKRVDTSRTQPPAIPEGESRDMQLFENGWRSAAVWANRDDLLADIGSPAYRRAFIAATKEQPK